MSKAGQRVLLLITLIVFAYIAHGVMIDALMIPTKKQSLVILHRPASYPLLVVGPFFYLCIGLRYQFVGSKLTPVRRYFFEFLSLGLAFSALALCNYLHAQTLMYAN